MLTLRIEDLGDHTGYVVMDEDGKDVGVVRTRRQAELVIATHGMGRDAIVDLGIDCAAAFALERHGEQPHGCLTIGQHLEQVAALVDAYCGYAPDSMDRLNVVSAAWLHDILEDTKTTGTELLEDFTDETVALVEAVTDSPGDYRYERHLNTYWRIREKGSDAVIIKLCDRLHNQSRSLTHKEHYLEMYAREYTYFKMALWRPGEHVKLWELLDRQFILMKDALDGTGLQEGSGVAQDPGASAAEPGSKESPLLGGEGWGCEAG